MSEPQVERRKNHERRRSVFRALWHGNFARRRHAPRRSAERHFAVTDWFHPQWLAVGMVVLLLSVADAFLTVTLLARGASEANPFMAFVLERHPELFATVKMLFTGIGVLVLVAVARTRLFSVVRVATVLHWLLVGYAALIFYEWSLLRMHV